MYHLKTAIALEAVYQTKHSRITREGFVATLRWAYRVKTSARAVTRFMVEVNAGCYNSFFA